MRSCSLGSDTAGQGCLALFLHLLLSELLGVALLLEDPIELAIVLVATALHQSAEKTAQVVVVGTLDEVQVTTVLQVFGELFGAGAA